MRPMHRKLAVLSLGVVAALPAVAASQDPAVGASAYSDLCRKHLIEPRWRTRPRAAFDCPLGHLVIEPVQIPKLLRAYLTLGAKICGPPALDKSFGTIDLLTLVDLAGMPASVRNRYIN